MIRTITTTLATLAILAVIAAVATLACAPPQAVDEDGTPLPLTQREMDSFARETLSSKQEYVIFVNRSELTTTAEKGGLEAKINLHAQQGYRVHTLIPMAGGTYGYVVLMVKNTD